MFEIVGEDKQLYQWDTDRKLIVSGGIERVHFSNTKYTQPFELEVVDGFVQVPPEILQIHGVFFAWGWADGNTRVEKQFNVEQRPRPSGYVYTPTEIQTWAEFEKEIKENLSEFEDKTNKTLSEMEKTLQAWSKDELVLWNSILSNFVFVEEVGV